MGSFRLSATGHVVLIGGTGVVGQRLAALLADKERMPLLVAGRNAERGEETAAKLRKAGAEARFEPWDVDRDRASAIVARAVIGLVNDPGDRLLCEAVRAGVPFVDVTRWTSRLASAVARLSVVRPKAPVVFASGWMGGLLPRVAATLAQELGEPLDSIEGAIRYALADSSGADSVEYMDRLWIPFEATQDGRPVTVMPFSERRRVALRGRPTTVWRFDTPEQWTLPFTLGARSVAVRLGFDRRGAGATLAWLVRLGFFHRFRADKHRALRHAMLRRTGAEKLPGADASFRVDLRGGSGKRRALTLATKAGQAALTAIGAWLSLRWALADGTPAGALFPENDPVNTDGGLLSLLLASGVEVVREDSP